MSYTPKPSTDEFIPYRQPAPDKSFLYARDAGFVLPLLQSIGTGAVSFLTLALLGWIWDWVHLWEIAVTAAALTTGLYWFLALARWNLVSWLENVTKLDINGDGQIGKPKAAPVMKLRISDVSNGRYSQTETELPTDPERLTVFARAILGGRSFSERTWSGSGKLFSGPQYRKLIEVLKARGLIQQKGDDERLGFELSAAGQATFEQIVSGNAEFPDD